MIFAYDDHNYFVVMHRKLTRMIFLKRAKVKSNTFAGNIFLRIYDCIFSELIDVKKEYNNYYLQEYTDFRKYLTKRFSLATKQVDKLLKLINSDSNLVLYRKEQYSYGDYSLEQFILSDSMKARIEKILLLQKEQA